MEHGASPRLEAVEVFVVFPNSRVPLKRPCSLILGRVLFHVVGWSRLTETVKRLAISGDRELGCFL
jgi:hypothetical protein